MMVTVVVGMAGLQQCVEFASLFFCSDLSLLVVIDSRNWIRLLPCNPKFLGSDAR